ncbi:MAG: hypothetical protein V3U87_04930 [Methylococcaceae bacterium]
MKKINKTPLIIAVGGTIASSLTSTAIQAETQLGIEANPFEVFELSAGYMQIAKSDSEKAGTKKMKDGSCGEGKCGTSMKGSEEKTAEGKCAGDKPMPSAKKGKEGKCGEGKCGSSK